ncbi:MAG: outer membrane lipoprotein-sorting protein, partial [Thermodesulfobacteriota bacterium]
MKGKIIAVIAAILLLSVANTKALSAQETSATDVIKKSLNAFYYQGSDMKVRVKMKLINRQGKERIREFVMLRKNEQLGGNQKYFIYFFRPADVERTTFMIWKYPEKDDDRWLFIPAVNLVRRIAANDKRSSFVGSDFTYEDVSGRDV